MKKVILCAYTLALPEASVHALPIPLSVANQSLAEKAIAMIYLKQTENKDFMIINRHGRVPMQAEKVLINWVEWLSSETPSRWLATCPLKAPIEITDSKIITLLGGNGAKYECTIK